MVLHNKSKYHIDMEVMEDMEMQHPSLMARLCVCNEGF